MIGAKIAQLKARKDMIDEEIKELEGSLLRRGHIAINLLHKLQSSTQKVNPEC